MTMLRRLDMFIAKIQRMDQSSLDLRLSVLAAIHGLPCFTQALLEGSQCVLIN